MTVGGVGITGVPKRLDEGRECGIGKTLDVDHAIDLGKPDCKPQIRVQGATGTVV